MAIFPSHWRKNLDYGLKIIPLDGLTLIGIIYVGTYWNMQIERGRNIYKIKKIFIKNIDYIIIN